MAAAAHNPKLLGEGRDRRVCTHGRGLVCKWAKNGDGRRQNLREAIVSYLAPAQMRTLARVTCVQDSGRRIVMERVRCVDETTFARWAGKDFVPRLLRTLRVAARERRDNRGTLGPEMQAMFNFLVRDMHLSLPDFERLENWGLRRVGRGWAPVLLDYGLSGRPDFFRRNAAALAAVTVSRRA